MAVVYTPFAPNPTAAPPFKFQLTLNGQNYTGAVTWNMSGQRWYLSIYTLQGVLVWSGARVGSPPSYDINLVAGFFGPGSVVFRAATQQFEVS